jgi:hypothetical protein
MVCTSCEQPGHNKRTCKKNTAQVSVASVQVQPDENLNQAVEVDMNWNPWTDKSKDVGFKSLINGIGDGEEKVAKELGTVVLGQNSCYDIKPIINGVPTQCDVKKLDTQNDFNTGVKGRDALRPIKINLSLLLDACYFLSEDPIFTAEEQNLLRFIKDKSPDELAVGTLTELKRACKMLNAKRNSILESIPVVHPFTDTFGPVGMTLDVYQKLCEDIKRPFPDEYSSYKPILQTLKYLDKLYVRYPDIITQDLDNLTDFLKDTVIIIVSEKKGYMFVTDSSKIRFMRITRATPRFQIIF